MEAPLIFLNFKVHSRDTVTPNFYILLKINNFIFVTITQREVEIKKIARGFVKKNFVDQKSTD
jgi:hypothetical protein